MTKKKYLASLTNNSGHINPFEVKTNDLSPDYGGYIKIDDKIYKVSGWVKLNKAGNKSLSIRVTEADWEGNIIKEVESNEI